MPSSKNPSSWFLMTRLKWNRSHMLIAFIIYNNQNCCSNNKLQKVTVPPHGVKLTGINQKLGSEIVWCYYCLLVPVRYTVKPHMAIFENWQGRGRVEKPSLPFLENLQKLLYVNLWFKFLIQNAVSGISRRGYNICNVWSFFCVLL